MSLHPFFVHFPIAFWLLGSLMLPIVLFLKRDDWWSFGWFLLYAATVMSIPAVLSGQKDFERYEAGEQVASMVQSGVNDEDQPAAVLAQHRDLGNILPWIMGIVCLVHLHGRYAKSAKALPRPVFVVVVLMIAVFICYAAYLGGSLNHGVGSVSA